MKTLVLFLCLISLSVSMAQTRYLTKTGTVNFEASVPSFEEVASKNTSVTAIINIENGEFAALALIKGFRFKNALMEEHFNENYAESHLFPKATFKGTIENFDPSNLQSNYVINGELTFHGVTQKLKAVPITITFQDNNYILMGNITLNPSNFNIEIPKIVRNKIADDVIVTFEFSMQKK